MPFLGRRHSHARSSQDGKRARTATDDAKRAVDSAAGQSKLHRTLTKPDGRCTVRAVLYAARSELPVGVTDILNGDDYATRDHIRSIRAAAAYRVAAACRADDTIQMLVTCSFPDENFGTFEHWLEAQNADDTAFDSTDLWKGGGNWNLYGLGLLLECSIWVTSFHPRLGAGGGFREGQPQLVVDRGGRRVDLAMIHDDDGCPDHFDVLEAPPAPPVTRDPSLPPSPPPSECGACTDPVSEFTCDCLSNSALSLGTRRCRDAACYRGMTSLTALMADASLCEEAPELTVVNL